jgi:hypothetical protein
MRSSSLLLSRAEEYFLSHFRVSSLFFLLLPHVGIDDGASVLRISPSVADSFGRIRLRIEERLFAGVPDVVLYVHVRNELSRVNREILFITLLVHGFVSEFLLLR